MLSVVMSVYNAEKYLSESIESILNQTLTEFDFIIINDKSTDSSLDIIKKYATKDKRIKLINNEKNIGLTKSLNKAINISNGKYIARMDADDIAHLERLEKQYKYLDKHPEVVVLGTSGFTINEDGDIINERNVPLQFKKIKQVLRYVNPMIHPSVMFRKKEIKHIGNYNEVYDKVQDYELWFRCVAQGYKMRNLKERLIYYRSNNAYFERKSLQYRMTALKIRWGGYNLLKIPYYKRYGVFIPNFLGLTPNFILKYSYKFLKKFDPR
ncbi:MAG: glycosyltransferase [bacterium]